MTESDMRHQIG